MQAAGCDNTKSKKKKTKKNKKEGTVTKGQHSRPQAETYNAFDSTS
jgi:hypothetical protein